MADQPPSQEQRAHRTPPPASDRPADPPTQHARDAAEAPDAGQQIEPGQRPGIRVGELKATAGRAGERNLTVEWIAVWVGSNRPCRFNVRTLAENGLEVVVEQLVYKKSYSGTGMVGTQVIPVVPIGTKGKLTARDTVTGETLEQPWTWVPLGRPGFFARLWSALKRSLWNPSS